jgi:hypothetical protein
MRQAFNLVRQKATDELEMQAQILKWGVAWPKDYDWDAAPAGWAQTIFDGIMEQSGFSRGSLPSIEDKILA